MGISDIIEQFIREALEDESSVNLQRNELASHFGCVPSQINYVISTRFTNERGYIVESRRGGGGGITIKKITLSDSNPIMHTINSIGETLDYATAKALIANLESYGVVTKREALLILSALTDNVLNLPGSVSSKLRSAMFKKMLVSLL